MKKSTVAVGIIVILGVAYVGTSWYTGNVIESNIDPKIAQLTQQINDSQDKANVAISYSDYQKGIFATKLHLTVTMSPKDTLESDQQPTTVFNDDITIHHGPFPFAALAKGTFAPQMAWAEYEMTEKASPELWKLAGNKPFITAYMGMSYQEYLTLKVVNKALRVNKSGSDFLPCENASDDASGHCTLDISAGDFSLESDKNLAGLLVKANLDKFTFNQKDDASIAINKLNLSVQPNSEKTGVSYKFAAGDLTVEKQDYYTTPRMTVNNISSQGSIIYPHENIDAQTSIEKITFIPDVSKKSISYPIVINQLTVNQKSETNQDKTLSGLLNSTIGSIWVDQQNLGYGSFDFDFQGVDENIVSNRAGFSNTASENLNENDQLNMKMSLNKFNWHNNAGDINVDFNLGVSGQRAKLRDFDIDNLDTLKLNIDAPFNVLAHFEAQVENPSASTVTDAQVAKANQSLQMISQMFLRNISLITFQKGDVNGIYSDVDYAKDSNEVKVNGKTMSKAEFFDNF